MDRRTLVALLLATAVVVTYQFVFITPSQRTATIQPETSTPPATAEIGTAEESHEAVEKERSFQSVVPADAPAPAPVVIQGDVRTVILTAEGGRITDWTLATYTDAQDLTANLVADPKAGLLQFAVVGRDFERDLSSTRYQQSTDPSGRRVELTATSAGGARVAFVYDFSPDDYSATLEVRLDGLYGPDRQLEVTIPSGLPQLERVAKLDQENAAALAMVGRRLVKHLHRGKKNGWSEAESGVIRWVGTRSKYFVAAIIPEGDPDGEVRFARTSGQTGSSCTLLLPLQAGETSVHRFRLYAGPMEYARLEKYGVELEKSVDLGWSVFVPFTRLLLQFFLAVHRILPNYGVVIILLSIIVKLVFFPLTQKSLGSMRSMQALKPEMDLLSAKFKDDPQRRNAATLELYRKHKINPMSGCLPLLVQIPVFGALYNVFNTSIQLRKAPFAFWITDLSSPDRLGAVLGQPIHALPLLMAASAFVQQKLTPTDPRQAGLMYMMPVITLVFFYSLPSGLVLYWTVTNILQIGQQILTNRTQPLTKAA